jgi:CelD/BcsL family acetyltransferase involved in cellulose biosynthesis
MRADVIPVSALGEDDLASWRRLASDAIVPNPYADPDFVRPSMRAWRADHVHMLVVRAGSEWLAALPVRHAWFHRGVPGRCLAVWRHSYCYLGTPLVAPGHPQAALECMIAGALRVAGCLSLDWIDADGPLAEPLTAALEATSRPVIFEEFERGALERHDQDDYLSRALSSRHRSEYRRRLRLLEGEVGSLALRDDSLEPAAYERFLALERSSWKGAAGTALDVRPGHGAFFTDICGAFAGSGRLTLLSLGNEERTVAMMCNLVAGDTSFGFKLAFDESLRRYGPGVQLLIAYMSHFHAGPLARLDSGSDEENPTVNRLLVDRRALRTVVATARNAAGRLDRAKWLAAGATLPAGRRLIARSRAPAAGRPAGGGRPATGARNLSRN